MKQSNLTPKLEEQFEHIYDLLNAARDGEDVGPHHVKDAVKCLESAVEDALVKAGRCAICEIEYPPLCTLCAEDEAVRWDDWQAEVGLRHAVSVGVG